MSITTWKKEFYLKKATSVSVKDSIAHSLKKWQGLTKTNLKKHGLYKSDSYIIDNRNERDMPIDDSSCALCQNYIDNGIYHEDEPDSRCHECPLYEFLGMQCDEKRTSPYSVWINKGNALPMINALKQTLKMVDKKNKTANRRKI